MIRLEIEKKYITKFEAKEVKKERGIKTLPRINREVITVLPTFESNLLHDGYNPILGHNNNGYYTSKVKYI